MLQDIVISIKENVMDDSLVFAIWSMQHYEDEFKFAYIWLIPLLAISNP